MKTKLLIAGAVVLALLTLAVLLVGPWPAYSGGDVTHERYYQRNVEAIRAKSKWWAKGDLLDWYARKTVVRRIAKYVPKNPALDLLFETEGAESPAEVVDPETGEVLSATVEGAPDADA